MFAFQPRGFVFEPVGMRLFFHKYSEAEGSNFFRHYETVQNLFFEIFLKTPVSFFVFFQKFLMSTKGPPFSLFDILQQNEC